MDTKKYFFVGKRFFCLEKMFELDLNVVCCAVFDDSIVKKELDKRKIDYVLIENKKQLLDLIDNTDFDVLVSNGCPYILPVSKLQKQKQIFINIHPSLLPDLKGINPVNGAILFDRPQGATCHMMDDGIDTGKIIAQVKVCDKPDMPLDLLYQLSFIAEAEAFLKAYQKDFLADIEVDDNKEYIYYSRKESDQILNYDDSFDLLKRKVEAFKLPGQFSRIIKNDHTYYVEDLIEFNTELFIDNKFDKHIIIHLYQNNVVTKYDNKYLLWRLDNVDNLKIGDCLF